MKINMLGTGNATVTRCYNTCFTISENNQYFLVDAGGGNGILSILEEENIPLTAIHDVFVSHGHTDHVMGVIWVIRMIGQMMNTGKYAGDLNVYCYQELAENIQSMCKMMLQSKVTNHFNERIHFVVIEDRQRLDIMGQKVEAFDIGSTKMKQFGFILTMKDGRKLTFCGDEPLNENLFSMAEGSDYFMHEAFCLYAERDIFKPYEKHHSTAKDASELAEKLHIKNAILYHTEDKHISNRKELYLQEGMQYFHGNLYVPDDREEIEL